MTVGWADQTRSSIKRVWRRCSGTYTTFRTVYEAFFSRPLQRLASSSDSVNAPSRNPEVLRASASVGYQTMHARAAIGWLSISWPQSDAVPPDLFTSPAKMLIKVDLPAPFGPKRPKIDPFGTVKSTCFSACLSGNPFVPLYVL